MCAIAGMIFLDRKDEHKTSKLSPYEAKTIFASMLDKLHYGGGDATGIFVGNCPTLVSTTGDIHMYKNNVPSNRFLEDKKTKDIIEKIIPRKTVYAVAHARAQTSGNSLDNKNNHPFKCGDVIGIHNGMVSNYRELIKSEHLVVDGSCDSEVIFRLLDRYSYKSDRLRVTDTCKKLDAWYACVAVDISDYLKIMLFRQGAPINLKYDSVTRTLLFSTRTELMESAIAKAKLSSNHKFTDEELPDGHGIILDTYNDTGWYGAKPNIFKLENETSKVFTREPVGGINMM